MLISNGQPLAEGEVSRLLDEHARCMHALRIQQSKDNQDESMDLDSLAQCAKQPDKPATSSMPEDRLVDFDRENDNVTFDNANMTSMDQVDGGLQEPIIPTTGAQVTEAGLLNSYSSDLAELAAWAQQSGDDTHTPSAQSMDISNKTPDSQSSPINNLSMLQGWEIVSNNTSKEEPESNITDYLEVREGSEDSDDDNRLYLSIPQSLPQDQNVSQSFLDNQNVTQGHKVTQNLPHDQNVQQSHSQCQQNVMPYDSISNSSSIPADTDFDFSMVSSNSLTWDDYLAKPYQDKDVSGLVSTDKLPPPPSSLLDEDLPSFVVLDSEGTTEPSHTSTTFSDLPPDRFMWDKNALVLPPTVVVPEEELISETAQVGYLTLGRQSLDEAAGQHKQDSHKSTVSGDKAMSHTDTELKGQATNSGVTGSVQTLGTKDSVQTLGAKDSVQTLGAKDSVQTLGGRDGGRDNVHTLGGMKQHYSEANKSKRFGQKETRVEDSDSDDLLKYWDTSSDSEGTENEYEQFWSDEDSSNKRRNQQRKQQVSSHVN